jgi:ribose transport system permease protein
MVTLGQLGTVSPKFGQQKEFTAIAAAVIGGTSLFGGRGDVLPGTFMGASLIQAIENGLVIVNADPCLCPIITGMVIFLAVWLESLRNLVGSVARLRSPSVPALLNPVSCAS